MQKNLPVLFLLFICSCIGVDLLDDEPVSPVLLVNPQQQALRIGETLQLMFSYTNEFGQADNVSVSWVSSADSVVKVDPMGLATAISSGQATIFATSGSIESNAALLTVVADDNAIASINILSEPLSLQVGDTITLQAEVLNINNEPLPGAVPTWTSSNPQSVAINDSGRVQALAEGSAELQARVDGVDSAPLSVTVGDTERSGVFTGSSGYTTEGMAILSLNEQDQLILELSEDFNTDFALGTFIYLSNSTNGASTRNNGLELAEINSDGPAILNVTNISSSTGLYDYRYVVVLCKPASITFGFADLGE